MRFWRDENGATLIYVSLIILMLTGITGLALDSGRLFSLRHEIQKAADAAALAGAWQLDGTLLGSQNADAAARTAPVAPNNQKFGSTPGAIAIASTSFWRGIPASDDTALTLAAPPYDYIEVTTSAVAHNTILMRVMGAAATSTVTGKAVARKGQSRCQQTPLFMCLPGGAAFDPAANIGRQVLMKAGGGNNWTNGNWGLLDTPSGSQSTGALANMIAGINGLPQCISTGISTKPGNVASLAPAFNVRLRHLRKSARQHSTTERRQAIRLRRMLRKGRTARTTSAPQLTVHGPTIPEGLVRTIRTFRAANRVGNGQWDCSGSIGR